MAAPISGSSTLFPQADGVDTEPEQPGVAPPPPPRISGKEARENQLGSWSGEPAGPEASSAGAPSPGLTAGMLAAGQASAPTAQEVLPQLDTLMRRNSSALVSDLLVTRADAREAVALLEPLPPREYRRALDEMNAKTLGQMLSEMDGDTRQTFFEQARQKGAISEEAGLKESPREGSPPDRPALIRNESSLRPELREAIHAENKSRCNQYTDDFKQYVGRYSEAALKASSPLALRLMGPPSTEFILLEPGLTGKDLQRFGSLGQGSTQRAPAAKAANDRISDFAGRTRAGSFTATLTGKFEAEVGGVGVKLEHKEKLTDYGTREAKNKAEASVSSSHAVGLGTEASGQTYEEFRAGDFKLKAEEGKLVEAEGKFWGVGLKLEEGKTTLSTGIDGLPIGTFATVDEKRGSYGAGVKLGSKLEVEGSGEFEGSLKVGFEVQGIAPERLPDIGSMKDEGIWGPMPELDGRVKWNSIAPERRERLVRDGWSESNWPVG